MCLYLHRICLWTQLLPFMSASLSCSCLLYVLFVSLSSFHMGHAAWIIINRSTVWSIASSTLQPFCQLAAQFYRYSSPHTWGGFWPVSAAFWKPVKTLLRILAFLGTEINVFINPHLLFVGCQWLYMYHIIETAKIVIYTEWDECFYNQWPVDLTGMQILS